MAESTGLLNLRGGNLSEGSNPSLSAILFSSLWFSSIGFCCIRQVECVTVWEAGRICWRNAYGMRGGAYLLAECVRYGRRGACPPPPTPPASGMVPVPGWVVGWAELDGRRGPVGIEPRKYDGLFPLFCGKSPSHFRSPSPVPSQYEFA